MKKLKYLIFYGFMCWLVPTVTLAQDSLRLMQDLAFLCSEERGGRYPGTHGHKAAGEYILQQFSKAGLVPHNDSWKQEFAGKNGLLLTNIYGVLPGKVEEYIVVGAHYDHLGTKGDAIYVGCDDNASGVAALLHIAKSLAGKQLQHTMVFVAFDGEEIGMLGSKNWVKEPIFPLAKTKLMINMDMVSKSAAQELYIAGTQHYPFLSAPLKALTSHKSNMTVKFGHDIAGGTEDDWTFASDHAPFHRKGIPFLYFGVEDHPHYHLPTDTFDNTDFSFFYQSAEFILEAILSLDQEIYEAR